MFVFNYLRKPKITIILAMNFLVFSCNQYDLIDSKQQTFNYEAFESFGGKFLVNVDPSNVDSSRSSQDIVDLINGAYQTNIVLP